MVARFAPQLLRYGIAALCCFATLGEQSADAQFVRGRVGGGLVIRAPFAPRIVIGPRPFIRPIAPVIRPVAPLVVPRRIVGGAVVARAPIAGGVSASYVPAPSYSGAQVYASQDGAEVTGPGAEVGSAAPAAASEQSFPTDADLQAMDDGNLLNALIGITNQLDADLARFNTGAQWRTYLRLPEGAVPPPTDNQVVLGLSSLRTTLSRFDKIAIDTAYESISGLPSFAASRAALAEVVSRFGSRQAPPQTPPQTPPQIPPQLPPQTGTAPLLPPQSPGVAQAAAQEELPVPSTPPPASGAPASERSILSR